MEENTNKESNVELKYYINQKNKEKRAKLKIKYSYYIFYNDITEAFYEFVKNEELKKNERKFENEEEKKEEDEKEFLIINKDNISYQYIGYLHDGGYIEISENDCIFLEDDFNMDNLEIMIKVFILNRKEENLRDKYIKINEGINKIYEALPREQKEEKEYSKTSLNLVVLTANPLKGIVENGRETKELRTMNDFNIITSRIQDVFNENDALKYTEFWPLTKEIFKNVIKDDDKRPKILHLICKSTYIVNDDIIIKDSPDYSSNFVNLIFEQENNYNMELINKKSLEEIFKDKDVKDNVKEITLIISTQLAEDVYKIFKDLGFKNVFIQHTTIADSSFISDFNYNFYQYLLLSSNGDNIYNIFDDTMKLVNLEKNNDFCCCYHKHKSNCEFMKNLINELFNDNETKNNLEDLNKTIPHFCHLLPKCPFMNCSTRYNNFCLHKNRCFKRYKTNCKFKKLKDGYNFCCCENQKEEHNINTIFKKDFNEREKNNIIRFEKCEITRGIKYFTDYRNMSLLLVGKNDIAFQVIEFIKDQNSESKYKNIYGSNNKYELEQLGKIIKVYYLEREHFKNKDKDINMEVINFSKSTNFSSSTKIYEDNESDSELEIQKLKSQPLMKRNNQFNIKEIELSKDNEETVLNEIKNIFNTIYFIYVSDETSVKKIIDLKISNKIIFFSKTEIKDIPSLKIIEKYKERTEAEYVALTSYIPNEYIELQSSDNSRYILKNEKRF